MDGSSVVLRSFKSVKSAKLDMSATKTSIDVKMAFLSSTYNFVFSVPSCATMIEFMAVSKPTIPVDRISMHMTRKWKFTA